MRTAHGENSHKWGKSVLVFLLVMRVSVRKTTYRQIFIQHLGQSCCLVRSATEFILILHEVWLLCSSEAQESETEAMLSALLYRDCTDHMCAEVGLYHV